MATQTECCNPTARDAERCLCCPMRTPKPVPQPTSKAVAQELPKAPEQEKPKTPKRRLSSWEILNGGLTRD